jgi:hypothetical protein
MDYPAHVVEAALEHWEELDGLKYKITPNLVPTHLKTSPGDEDYYLQEGNTLAYRGSRTTRVPHNSNANIERLCVLTADIEMARKVLSQMEDFCLMARFMEIVISDEAKVTAEIAFEKVLVFLNNAD